MKIIVAIICGFILNTSLRSFYMTKTNNNIYGDVCTSVYKEALKDSKNDHPLRDRFQCAENKTIGLKYIKYLIVYPILDINKWRIEI